MDNEPTNTITFREHAELPTVVDAKTAIHEMWEFLETGTTYPIFGRLFDRKLITLAEFEHINYICGIYVSGRFDWQEYPTVKATILMFLLAELGEL